MNKKTSLGGDEASRVAERINRIRKEKNLSVEELSARTGIPTTTLYRKLGTNPDTLTLRELILISDALHLHILDVAA